MAIQLLYSNTFFDKLINIKNILIQIIKRNKKNGVFIRYYTNLTHESFKQYYDNPPIKGYSNFWNAKLLHWINSPAFIDKRPFIIEINDHPLSVIGFIKRGAKPSFIIQKIDEIGKIYSMDNCVKIIFPCNKMVDLFQYYFGHLNLTNKFEIIQGLGCYKRKPITIPTDQFSTLKFLCICSDFRGKGLDLIIDTWLKFVEKKLNATLTIVCHNIPDSYKQILLNSTSIRLITEAPLSTVQKIYLYQNHHVSLAPTHIHCGAVIYEAIEYGHAIVYFEFHSSVHSHYGIEVKVPFTYYTPKYFGKIWNDFSDYFNFLAIAKKQGEFKKLVSDLGNIFSDLILNREKTKYLSNRAYDYANDEYSLEKRNIKLAQIYLHFV